MNKEDIHIVVVPTKDLFLDERFQGFCAHDEVDYRARILKHFTYMRRGDAEIDPTFKQPISYALIRNSAGDIFIYQRGSKRSEYHESRLAGKWSAGIGGHIEEEDEVSGDILGDSLMRELAEEITIDGKILGMDTLGYINDDTTEVGKVHIGVLYVIDTDAHRIQWSEEVVNERFYTIEEVRSMLADPTKEFESWTRIALDHLLPPV